MKHQNMVRDPRVSITVINSADPENYVELRGVVSTTPDLGRRIDTGLSWKYDEKDPGEDGPGQARRDPRSPPVEILKATGPGARVATGPTLMRQHARRAGCCRIGLSQK